MKQFSLILPFIFIVNSAFAEKGAADILVSDQGLPKKDYQIEVDGKKHTTDDFGYVSLTLAEGEHQLVLRDVEEEKVIKFKVSEDERTQLIVNIFKDQLFHDVNEPVKSNMKTLDEVKDWGELSLKILSVSGTPVSGVRVFAKGTIVNQTSSRNGGVRIKLPVGKQTLSLTHPKFSSTVLRDIEISKDQLVEKNVELTPAGLVLDDFVVLAPNMKGSIQALIEVRRKASDVADVMSAEQMSKTGDGDAAGSLKRVTGLTLKDGKYVYVRGLGERYSATLLNGVALPSPDPSRRVIPLDLFPTPFLDSMVIQKSYSPNQPGEFGGGVVMLKAKSMPSKFFFKASISQSMNSNDGDMKTYSGGGKDWMGVDDGGRKLPGQYLEGGGNPNALLQRGDHTLEGQLNDSMPEFNFSIGDRFNLKALKLGYTLSGVYKDTLTFTEESRGRFREENGKLLQEDNYIRDKTQKERVLGGIAGLHTELFKKHKLSFSHINIRNTTDYVAVLEGENAEGNTIRETGIEWAARSLKTNLLQGENTISALNDLKISYSLADSKARRDEPSRINYRYSPNNQGVFSYDPSNNTAYERRYYDLSEEAQDYGLEISTPLPYWRKQKPQLALGVKNTEKQRISTMRRFGFNNTGVACGADLSGNLDSIFADCPEAFQLVDTTRPTDNYTANQEIQSYYFNTKWPLLDSLQLSSGMRFEKSVQEVNTVSPFKKDSISSRLLTRDWLPGSALTWKFNKKMQMRLAYSETISRPDLRELSNTLWQDFETGYDVQGNPDLKATVIESYDMRWEWYFTNSENLSLGFFYKNFENPIEQVFTSGSDPRISFFNVDGATIYGGEIEFSKNFGFIAKGLRNFSLSGNYAYILSDVRLGELKNSESNEVNRPLQGQSNYTANVLLDYKSKSIGLTASLAYNVYGKRIAYTAPEGLPNIWENSFHQLDFVLGQKIGKATRLQAKVKNILNPRAKLIQGDQEWQGLRKGVGVSFGMAMEI